MLYFLQSVKSVKSRNNFLYLAKYFSIYTISIKVLIYLLGTYI